MLYSTNWTNTYTLEGSTKTEIIPNTGQHWVHPLLTVRYVEGNFHTHFEKLRADNKIFLITFA